MEYKIVLIQDVKIVIMLGFLSMICIFEYSVIRLYNERKRTLIYMREKKVQLYVDSQERSILLIPKAKEYLPTLLMDGNSLIYGTVEARSYVTAIYITVLLSVVCLAISFPVFNKKYL